MNKIGNFIRTAGIYLLGTVFSKLLSLLLVPLYTNYIDPAIMGEYDYANTIISFLAPICFFQIWDAMFRFSFEKNENEYKIKVVNNAFFTEALGIVVYTVIFLIVNIFTGFQSSGLVFVYGLSIALNYLYAYIARVYLDNVLYVLSGFASSLMILLLNIVLIVYFHCGLEALFISSIVGLLVQCVIVEIKIKPLKHLDVSDMDRSLIADMVKFALPLCISTVSYWLLSGLTKVIIVNKLGTYENGLYAVTNRIAMILNLVVSIFQYAWNETAYMSNADSDRFDMFGTAVKYIIQYVMVFAVLLMVAADILFPIFIGDMYQEAARYLPISITAIAFNSVAGFYGTIISTEKKTKYIFISTAIAAAINCILAPIMTDEFGLYGALAALAISFAVLMVVRTLFMSKKIGVKINAIEHWPLLFLPLGFVLCIFANTVVQLTVSCGIIVLEVIINKEQLSGFISSIRHSMQKKGDEVSKIGD